MTAIAIRLLGTFEVVADGAPLTRFRSQKNRALLAYLATEADREHQRSMLAGLLWPDLPDKQSALNLRQAIFRLRKLLPDTAAIQPFLNVSHHTVQWNREAAYSLDVAVMRAEIEETIIHEHASRQSCALCVPHLERVADLYRGDVFRGFLF